MVIRYNGEVFEVGHTSNYILIGNRSFRQRVSSPTTSSPTYEVDSPTSNVSSPTLICQFANVQNTFGNRSEMYLQVTR